MLYLDTSLLVAALTKERRTGEMQTWLTNQTAGTLAVSDWVITEFSAAISLKRRTGQLNDQQRADSLALFTELADESFERLSIARSEYKTAARFADQHRTGLRAGDALHLAVVARHGLRLVTLDQGLSKAASGLGISNRLL